MIKQQGQLDVSRSDNRIGRSRIGQSRIGPSVEALKPASAAMRVAAGMAMLILTLVLMVGFATQAQAQDGLVKVKSAHDVKTTADKLQAVLEAKGMNVFARLDHAAGAAKADLELGPTELLIFGNPKVGTPLMQCSRSIAIDLPQKALIWEAADGTVWLAYNDPEWLKARHATAGCDEVFGKVAGALGKFAAAATAP